MSDAGPHVDAVDVQPSALGDLIRAGDRKGFAALLERLDPGDLVRTVARLEDEDRTRLLSLLDPDDAATLLGQLPEALAVDAMEDLEPVAAARILEELPSDEQADLIGELDEGDARAIIRHLPDSDAAEVQRLLTYADDVAGGLMVMEYLAYPIDATVAQVIEDLGANAEKYADYNIQYLYVTGADGALAGVLRMRDLVLSSRWRRLREIMIPDPSFVRDTDTLERLAGFFDEHRYFGVPVVDAAGALCGVVQRSAVEAAVADDRDRIYLNAQGIVGGEELRTMPLLLRARRRLSWLSVNIVLNIIAASVIALHQDTLEAVIALAVFLPIISDMSGCSGNQAVAVSMRELTLGVIGPRDLWRTVAAEVTLGLLNGLVLGVLLALVAIMWKGQPYLGLVVGGALMLNTVIAVIIGGSVPLLLKRMGVDPALASGPILTTITDMCGFFIVLTMAAALIGKLT
ncbi:MAG: magnesium transporter [Phycisphaerales bacterium]|nr:magnesium transporter [Phycisphaerales bacterium]